MGKQGILGLLDLLTVDQVLNNIPKVVSLSAKRHSNIMEISNILVHMSLL